MPDADMRRVPIRTLLCYAQHMSFSDRQLALSRTPFVGSTELALILGEPHSTVHRTLADLLAEGIVGRVSHGTAHLPSSQRYHLTAKGIGETAWTLGFDTPSDFVRAHPVSRRVADAAHPPDGRYGFRLPTRCPPASTGSGPSWSSTAGGASTPPSRSTTVAASAWCARAWPCGAGLFTTG